MPDVRIAFIKKEIRPDGTTFKAGQLAVFGSEMAAFLVSKGVAVYYADYSPSMIEAEEEEKKEAAKPVEKKGGK